MLDQILTKEQKKALKKHFNSPESKARHKRMDALEKKMLEKDAEEFVRQVLARARREKIKKWIMGVIVLLIIIWATG
jgi:hypothetical protein